MPVGGIRGVLLQSYRARVAERHEGWIVVILDRSHRLPPDDQDIVLVLVVQLEPEALVRLLETVIEDRHGHRLAHRAAGDEQVPARLHVVVLPAREIRRLIAPASVQDVLDAGCTEVERLVAREGRLGIEDRAWIGLVERVQPVEQRDLPARSDRAGEFEHEGEGVECFGRGDVGDGQGGPRGLTLRLLR